MIDFCAGEPVTELEFMKELRADAIKDLDRVKVLARILPFTYLEWLDQRAATLTDLIRQYDTAVGAISKPSQG